MDAPKIMWHFCHIFDALAIQLPSSSLEGFVGGHFFKAFLRRILNDNIQKSKTSGQRSYVFSQEGVTSFNDMGKEFNDWGAFIAKGEIEHYVYLQRQDNKMILIDKNQLPTEQWEQLSVLLNNVRTADEIDANPIIIKKTVFQSCLNYVSCFAVMIIFGYVGICAFLALAVAILFCQIVNDETEQINTNGTVTVKETQWLDPPRYSLYRRENFLVLRYLRDSAGPKDTDDSITEDDYQKQNEQLDNSETIKTPIITDNQEENDEVQKEEERQSKANDGYSKIYQEYLKDSATEYTEKYTAKGESYVYYQNEKERMGHGV